MTSTRDTLTHDSATLELLRAHADPSHLMCGIDDLTLERNARNFLGL
ncbi:hypothetical protein [Mycolicibacterium hodleri]|nr:hypothetical protein [Mycolicibacterium hodleri]